MKAIVVEEYGSEDVLAVSNIDVPSVGSDEVLVEVHAAGINPVDTYIREGSHVSAPPVPFTPGKDGAGMVVEVGSGVDSVKPGQRVYIGGSITGTYAEFCKTKEHQVHPLPDEVSFETGAGVFVPCATAYRALVQKGLATSESSVLIHGASGSVGLAAIQFAKNLGARVIGTASSEKGRLAVSSAGADHVFDHYEDGYLKQIKDELGGVDIILEMLANVNLVRDFEALSKGGTIVVIGSRGKIEFDPRLTMTNEVTIKGMSLFNASQSEMKAIHSAIAEGLNGGYLSPPISSVYELEEAPEAHREVIETPAHGKIVLKIR